MTTSGSGMNTANLQMEGLLLALAALLDAMKRNGLLSREDVQAALEQAEKAGTADGQRPDDLSHAQVEAILFPIRFLKQVNDYLLRRRLGTCTVATIGPSPLKAPRDLLG